MAIQFSGGMTIQDGVIVIPDSTPVGYVSGDPNLSLGTTVDWTSNTYFYTANSSTIGVSGKDYQYDTNNMVWQLFYAHKSIRIPAGSNRWGPISRQGGNNTFFLRGIVSPNTNNKTNWGSNVETILSLGIQGNPYTANVLFQSSTSAAITIPANRYFLLGINGGPYYKNYRITANNFTAVNAGNAIFTVLNEVYVGPWPSGPNSGVPNQIGGNASSYLRFTSNTYYSGIKFEIV